MSGQPRVDIALATYNGAQYLPKQLASFARQTYPSIRICVSDDGSSDDTLAVIAAAKDWLDIQVAPSATQRNIVRNFENALRCTNARYVALSDQDDYWDPRKIELLLMKVTELEARFGRDVPALAFSDLSIVDERLEIINASYFRSSIKSSEASRFPDFVINNHVPGCAMLMNRALIDLALPFPEVDIHDHWLIQIAAILGHVGYVDVPLVHYRQHGSNSIGLAHFGESKPVKALRLFANLPREVIARHRKWSKQAASIRKNMAQICNRFGDRLPKGDRAIVDAILGRRGLSRIVRTLGRARHGERWIDYVGVLIALAGSPATKIVARSRSEDVTYD